MSMFDRVFANKWFRLAEGILLFLFLYILVYHSGILEWDVGFLSLLPATLLIIYLETSFHSPWPRIIIPLGMFSLSLLAERMFFLTLPMDVYIAVIMIYNFAALLLFLAVSNITSILLWERKSKFEDILNGIRIDMYLFLAVLFLISIILLYHHAIKPFYTLALLLVSLTVWILTPWFTDKYIMPPLLMGGSRSFGFAHPREPEAEKLHLSISMIIALLSLLIPLIFAYTGNSLVRRAYVPLALLTAYEGLIIPLYVVTRITGLHGALLESLMGDKYVPIENYHGFKGWRDIVWFLNRGAGYFLRLKYLSALYMHFQGLEILSLRTGDKEIYYGPIHLILREGYDYLRNHKSASKYVPWRVVEKILEKFSPENIYVTEPDTSRLEGTGFEELYKRALSGVVNLYCKLIEIPEEARKDAEQLVIHSIDKLKVLARRGRGDVREILEEAAGSLEKLLEKIRKGELSRDNLETFLVRKPLTVNMLRNYLVHGQLYKNAIVYRGDRTEFDRLMEKPATLYTLYVLILSTTIKRHPEIIGDHC